VRRARRTWPQRLLLTFNTVLVVVCLASAGGLVWAYNQASDLPRIDLGTALSEPTSAGEPQNVLLVGIDSGAGLAEGDKVNYGRSATLNTDTIMILRVDPGTGQAAILSIPRDLYIPLSTGGSNRINAALAIGGPQALIETIKQNFNIPINHYAMVDFAGFRSLVEAVDGIPMFFETGARDEETGLYQYELGCVTLDPEQALAFARSRHYEINVNGKWREDPTGDFGRISRQQLFIRRALERAVAKGARNPFVLRDLLEVAQKNVTLDDEYTIQDIVDLGTQFRDFDPASLDTYTVPGNSAMVGAMSVVKMNDASAQPVLDIFRGVPPVDLSGLVPPTDPSTPTPPTTASGVTTTTRSTLPLPSSTTTTTVWSYIPETPEGVACG
jgi:LCP family protein required for cell wall assembly